MARSKSDISNSAIRIFLQDVGKFYDLERGLEAFGPKAAQKRELLEFFERQCCYCGAEINEKTFSQDHLVPMNKTHLGLHAWGNVVPCCSPCNNEKQQKDWREFLASKAGSNAAARQDKIEKFVQFKLYDPTLNLHRHADNLYEDIGEVAMTLIRLRYEQAQTEIRNLLAENMAEK